MTINQLSILLVGDNPEESARIEQFVREKKLPYQVSSVHTISQARQYLQGSICDLVLLDCQLSDGNCFDLLPEIKNIPAIIMSVVGNQHVAIQALCLGASDYLIKSPTDTHLDLFPAVVEKVLKKKQIELDLRQSKETVQAVIANAMDGVITMSQDGIVEWFNPAAERIFGYKWEEIVGKNINILMAEPTKSEHNGYIKTYLNTGESKILGRPREVVARRKNGEEFYLELSASEMLSEKKDANLDNNLNSPQPGRRMFMGIVRDITERKRTEEELRIYRENLEDLVTFRTAELRNTYNQLVHSEKLAATGKLSAAIAHEFNNPIYGIRNVLEQLYEEVPLNETFKHLVSLSLRECNRIADLTKKLQDFFMPSSGVMTEINIHEIIDDITLLLRNRFIERNIALEKRFAPDLPNVKIIGDQVKQVFLDIIQNAEEAIPMSATGGKITITTEKLAGRILIHINDTGIGISPEHVPVLFDPFFTTKRGIKGGGMGLSVSYGIIKKHGGTIHVTSEPGNTTFTISIPIQSTNTDSIGARGSSEG